VHSFDESIRKAGPHSAWCGGRTISYIRENGREFELCFTDGTTARFEVVNDNGEPLKGKLRCKSLGVHINAKYAKVGQQVCR
jgi:hypothetical protein